MNQQQQKLTKQKQTIIQCLKARLFEKLKTENTLKILIKKKQK